MSVVALASGPHVAAVLLEIAKARIRKQSAGMLHSDAGPYSIRSLFQGVGAGLRRREVDWPARRRVKELKKEEAIRSSRRDCPQSLGSFPHHGVAVMLPSTNVLEQRILSMKPEHETRRKIIREWMSLPKDKRQTEEQAKPFARKAMERLPSSGDPNRQIMSWLLPRIGKP